MSSEIERPAEAAEAETMRQITELKALEEDLQRRHDELDQTRQKLRDDLLRLVTYYLGELDLLGAHYRLEDADAPIRPTPAEYKAAGRSARGPRRCGKCHRSGHDIRTCPGK